MITLDEHSMVQRLEPLAAAPMGDELAMVDLDTGKYIVLDRLGTVIWHMLQEAVQVADLTMQLGQRFEVERERCAAEVLTFLRDMHGKGLLRVWSV